MKVVDRAAHLSKVCCAHPAKAQLLKSETAGGDELTARVAVRTQLLDGTPVSGLDQPWPVVPPQPDLPRPKSQDAELLRPVCIPATKW